MLDKINIFFKTALISHDDEKYEVSAISTRAVIAYGISGIIDFHRIRIEANEIRNILNNNKKSHWNRLSYLRNLLDSLERKHNLADNITSMLVQYHESKKDPSVENPFSCDSKVFLFNSESYSCRELAKLSASAALQVYEDNNVIIYLIENDLKETSPAIKILENSPSSLAAMRIFLSCIESSACYICIFDLLKIKNINCIDQFFMGVEEALKESLIYNRMSIEQTINLFKAYSFGVSTNTYNDLHDKSLLLDSRSLTDEFFTQQGLESDTDEIMLSKSHLNIAFQCILQSNIKKNHENLKRIK